jgi:hypothetical protein
MLHPSLCPVVDDLSRVDLEKCNHLKIEMSFQWSLDVIFHLQVELEYMLGFDNHGLDCRDGRCV